MKICEVCGNKIIKDVFTGKKLCTECRNRAEHLKRLPNLQKIGAKALKLVPDGKTVCYVETMVFHQVWSDTSCGLATDPHYMAGQMITFAYTTVISIGYLSDTVVEPNTINVVFFDGVFAYAVADTNHKYCEFEHDLEKRQLKPVYKAKETYNPLMIKGEYTAFEDKKTTKTIDTDKAVDIVHKTINEFFDVCPDDKEEPMSPKDIMLLEINKAICNKIKEESL